MFGDQYRGPGSVPMLKMITDFDKTIIKLVELE